MQLLFALFLAAAPPTRLADLQQSLNAAIPDDKPIVLTQGDDFWPAYPGTVIFISRAEGISRLIAMARAGDDELSMFYLPRWGAWVAEAVIRTVNFTYADARFCEAAMMSEPMVELWHFHNVIGVPDVGNNLTLRQISLMWSVPGPLDFEEMYAWAAFKPKAQFRGFVAGVHGVVEYWADGYDTGIAPVHLVRATLVSESQRIKRKAAESGLEGLAAMLEADRGLFRYRFTPFP